MMEFLIKATTVFRQMKSVCLIMVCNIAFSVMTAPLAHSAPADPLHFNLSDSDPLSTKFPGPVANGRQVADDQSAPETKQYIYVVNASAAIDNGGSVSVCGVNSRTGTLTGVCQLTGENLFSYPHGVALSHDRKLAYVTNTLSGTISKCSINLKTGMFASCVDAGASGLAFPNGITIDKNGKYSYITNLTSNSVSVCKIDGNYGTLTCQDSGGEDFGFPPRITLNPDGSRAYISNDFLKDGKDTFSVSVCDVSSSTGQLNNCQDAGGADFQTPSGMAFDPAGTHLYIANETGYSVSVCTIDASTGHFVPGSCQDTGATNLYFPDDIVLNSEGTHAYISNSARDYSFPSSLEECTVNSSTHLLGDCQNIRGNFNHPSGIALSKMR
jgi:DNA-binding beta-propeller fold protein YncE